MTVPTVVVARAGIEAGEVVLEGRAHHHLFRVRRHSAGDELRLVDGEGGAWSGWVVDLARAHARVEVGEPLASHEPEHRVELVVGALRRERASWLVEKATELGAGAVRFVASERSPRRFGASTFERLRRVARGAVEQCGRSLVPEVTGVHDWSEMPELIAAGTPWVLDPGAAAPLGEARGPVVLLIGPEGGWSAEERDRLLAAGARPAGLGRRVLRVETAAVAALARLLAS